MKKLLSFALISASLSAFAAVSFSTDFESPYTIGDINGQDGWSTAYYAGSPPQFRVNNFGVSASQGAEMDFTSTPVTGATGGIAWHWLGHDPMDTDSQLEISYDFDIQGNHGDDTTLANFSLNKVSDGSAWMNFQYQASPNPDFNDSMWLYDSTQANPWNFIGGTGVSLNNWKNVKLRYNSTTGMVQTWLDGNLTNRPFFTTSGLRVGWSNMLTYTFGANNDNAVVFDNLNVQSRPDAFLTGKVNLEGYTSAGYAGPYDGFISWVQAEFYLGGTLVDSSAGYVTNGDDSGGNDISGDLTLDCALPDGTYDVIFDGWYCLKGKTTVTVLGGTGTVNITLKNGDTNDDGVVDLTDYTAVATAFNGLLVDPANGGNPSTNFLYEAELNGDGVVDLTDYTLVATNFNALDDTP
jgi:hypothetical protein